MLCVLFVFVCYLFVYARLTASGPVRTGRRSDSERRVRAGSLEGERRLALENRPERGRGREREKERGMKRGRERERGTNRERER